MREGFLEDERLEAGDGAQQLPGQGPHILWDRLSLASPLFLKDQSQFFLSPYMFHPELGMGAWREIGHRPGPKEWRSSWGQWPEAKVVAAGAEVGARLGGLWAPQLRKNPLRVTASLCRWYAWCLSTVQ